MGSERENASLPQQSPARVRFNRDAAEPASVDARNPVVLREPLVHEDIVRRHQIEHAAIFLEDALEEQFRFLAKALAEVIVEIGEQIRVRLEILQIPKLQPLS